MVATTRSAAIRLGSALVLAPVAWATYVTIGWVLPAVACETGVHASLHAAGAVALLASLAGVAAGVGELRASGGRAGDGSGPSQRRFLLVLGIAVSGLFAFGVVIVWLFTIGLHPCD